jgi:Sigma-70 region 3
MATPLRPPLRAILEELLASSVDARFVSLDALGEAIGTVALSTDEIDAIVTALEAEGRTVGEPEAALGTARLAAVLETARVLARELGRAPTRAEIAARAGMTDAAVRHALELAKVMQR